MNHAVIAVRGGFTAKSRCASRLSPCQRGTLALLMLEDMIVALAAARWIDRVHVITATPDIAKLATSLGTGLLTEKRPSGLNVAFETARQQIAENTPDDRIMLLPGDLPMLDSKDVDRALATHPPCSLGIVPAHDCGTNALILTAALPVACCFGIDSAAAHLAAASAAGVNAVSFQLPSLSFDIDRPADLDRLAREGVSSKAGRYLSRLRAATDCAI